MKKKKRDNSNVIAGIFIGATFIRRQRRFHGNVLPLISAFFGFLLLLLVSFSLLVPSPILYSQNHHLSLLRQPRHHHQHSSHDEVAVELRSNSDPDTVLRVPAGGVSFGRDLWRTTQSELYCGCSNASRNFASANVKTHPNRYLLIATSGGLNQQRTGVTDITLWRTFYITDAVVAAYILNATLVVPKLDQKSFWKDTSNFADIFDVDHFISFLSKDVEIIKQLPDKGGKPLTPRSMRVPRKCTPKCYQNRVLPVLIKKHVVQLSKFDYRLSNKLNKDLQKLRCRVNYHALKFTDSILEMGKKLVERMTMRSKHFIALHLRFEPDMLAFSGCDFGGGEKERQELGAIRSRWKSLHTSNPDKVRRNGRCPLTPEEVGLMLRALGFGSDVHLYVASGEVYGGEETLAPLKELFPNYHSKDTLASKEELAPFSSFSSRMAALDFIVSDESDVFVTNNNGNMARILAGRRRFFGHKPTIRPNAKKLYKLFMNRNNMTWEEFASSIRTNQIGFMGAPNEVKPGRGEFHENPSSCICELSAAKAKEIPNPQNQNHDGHKIDKDDVTDKDTAETTDGQISDDEQDWSEMDYMDNASRLQGKGQPNATDSDSGFVLKSELSELDEFFSD